MVLFFSFVELCVFQWHYAFGILFNDVSCWSVSGDDIKNIFVLDLCRSYSKLFGPLPNDLISWVSDAVLMASLVNTAMFGTFL